MVLAELRAAVVRYARKMVESGLVRATQGNLSARDTTTGLICITPSGLDYDEMTPADIAVVDQEGAIVEGTRRPSSEIPVHSLIFRRRPDVGCVMHTHSLYATAVGVVCPSLPIVLAEAALCLGGTVPVVPYQLSGTPAFAERVVETLRDGNAVIWGNHGALVVAPTLALAYSAAHALEDGARVYTIARQLGTPTALGAEAMAELHTFWREHYARTHNS